MDNNPRQPTAAELVAEACAGRDVAQIAYWHPTSASGCTDGPDIYAHNFRRAVLIQDEYDPSDETPGPVMPGWTFTHYALTFTPDGDPELGEDLTDPETTTSPAVIRALLADLITESNTRTN